MILLIAGGESSLRQGVCRLQRFSGPTEIDPKVRQFIGTWGAPRIHSELLMLWIEVAESTVAST